MHLPREQQRELVTSLERGTLRLTQLIDNLLESVRIESGQLAIRQQSVALAEVVDDAPRAGRIAAGAARARQLAGEPARGAAALLSGDKHAPDPGVRQPARQCQQVRSRGQRGAHRRRSARRGGARLGRG